MDERFTRRSTTWYTKWAMPGGASPREAARLLQSCDAPELAALRAGAGPRPLASVWLPCTALLSLASCPSMH
eukprot:scaffold19525_cov26-Tisochrysis_lutea.AAC.2